jgi:hypothetical protein
MDTPANTGRRGTGRRFSSAWAFALLVGISIAFLAASSAPTPLYAVYQQQLGLPPVLLTTIFAAYPVTLLLALLVAGSVSDHIGRRPAIIGSLILEVGVLVIFLLARNVGELIAARALQGVATGVATAALGAALADLDARRAPVYNSIAPLIGLAVGALGSAELAANVQTPASDIFGVLIVLFVVLMVVSLFLPESALRRPGLRASFRISVSVPPGARRALFTAGPMFIAVWALGGFILSLGPNLLRAETGAGSALAGGWLVFALTASGAVAVALLNARPAHHTLIAGAAAMMAGLAVTFTSVALTNPVLLFVGTVIAGAGFGAGFQGAMRTVIPKAPADQRAGLLSTIYVISYLSMGTVAIGAGLLAAAANIQTSVVLVGALSTVLALVALIGAARSPKALRAGQPTGAA